MGIVIENAPAMPEISYNHIHVLTLTIEQAIFMDDTLHPKYQVYILYKLYGVHENVRYYEPGATRRLKVEDFYQLAMERYLAGNPAFAQAMGALEIAISTLISEQTEFKNSEVL